MQNAWLQSIHNVVIAKYPESEAQDTKETRYPWTEGIELTEIAWLKAAGEYLHHAWPWDNNGSHLVKNWLWKIRLEKGMAQSKYIEE